MDPDRTVQPLQNSQRIIADMVAVGMRDDDRVDIHWRRKMVGDGLPASFHRTQPEVDDNARIFCPQGKAVAIAAAGYTFEIDRHGLIRHQNSLHF